MKELDSSTVESSELVEQTFEFWFKGNEHIRSPFPDYIRAELKENSTRRFFEWASTLKEDAGKEINDTILGEKFEEIVFEAALGLVLTEDEKITINYPFMPRMGDAINNQDEGNQRGKSLIIDRSIQKEGDKVFLKVKLEGDASGEVWETKFELPV